jgi:hypothetical protein
MSIPESELTVTCPVSEPVTQNAPKCLTFLAAHGRWPTAPRLQTLQPPEYGDCQQGEGRMKSKKLVTLIGAVGVWGAMSIVSKSAEAASLTCSVSNVAWSTGNSGTLQIYCSGVGHWAFGSHSDTDCPSISIDARRSWQGLAQAALLSGKTLLIEFTPGGTGVGQCSGGPSVSFVRLNQ